MREIKFRGKCLDNGEWVEGSLFNSIWRKSADGSRVCYIFPDNMLDDNGGGDCWEDFAEVAEQYEVDSATVGQYTGLNDNNGKEIYEDDIINYVYCGFDRRGAVRYENNLCGFDFIDKEGMITIISSYEARTYCIIGNIHDNPELLK